MTEYIFISPHLDDAVLSCGAIIHTLTRQQHHSVEIWTLFAGDIPEGPLSPFAREIHERWNTGELAPQIRRAEDKLACERLGATARQLTYPDCIYRLRAGSDQPVIMKNEDLFSQENASQDPLIDEITQKLIKNIPSESILILPLGVGNHLDHLIARTAAEKLPHTRYYYADYPYSGEHPDEIPKKLPAMTECISFPMNNQTIAAWQYAVEAYTSQISTFWSSLSQMYQAIEDYAHSKIGNCLWKSN